MNLGEREKFDTIITTNSVIMNQRKFYFTLNCEIVKITPNPPHFSSDDKGKKKKNIKVRGENGKMS